MPADVEIDAPAMVAGQQVPLTPLRSGIFGRFDAYEITRISYGYDESADSVPAETDEQMTYAPYYQIDYLYTMQFGDQEKQISCGILINALDGTIIRIRGV